MKYLQSSFLSEKSANEFQICPILVRGETNQRLTQNIGRLLLLIVLLVIVKPSACRKKKKKKTIYIYINRVRDGPAAVVNKKRDNNSLIKSTRH